MVSIKGRGLQGVVEGEALVLPRSFTFFGGVDWDTGRLTVGDPELDGQSIKGRIFVFKAPSGGQGTAWKIGEMVRNGTAPLGIVVHRSNSVIVSGCIMGKVPFVADSEEDPTELFRTGDIVRVDGRTGTVELVRRADA